MDEKPADLEKKLLGGKDEETADLPNKSIDFEENPNVLKETWAIFRLSFFPTIAMVFHPMYMVMNSIFLSSVPDATLQQAAFGLGQMFISIVFQSITATFSMGLGTFVGQAHGSKDPKLCAIYLRRQ